MPEPREPGRSRKERNAFDIGTTIGLLIGTWATAVAGWRQGLAMGSVYAVYALLERWRTRDRD